jgi:Flp pilus assembly protein TadD
MSKCIGRRNGQRAVSFAKAAIVAAASLSLGACAGLGDAAPDFLASNSAAPAADASLAPAGDSANGPAELAKATEYWGKKYSEKPQDLEAALAFAKNLKAMGQKGQAMAVLQQASIYHGANKKLASEYGRLALELDQITVAQQMLAVADDPVAPDWRVVSARGTAMAKQGKYQEAIPFYDRALTLAPNQPSVLNNLALAYTMNGEPAKAEDLLRQAGNANPNNAKVNQNLALVLGLQGKYDEATKVASSNMPAEKAASNTALVRQMVKLEPKVLPQGVIVKPAPVLVAGSGAATAGAGLKPAVGDQPAAAWATKVAVAAPVQSAAKPAASAATVIPPAPVSASTQAGDFVLKPSAR